MERLTAKIKFDVSVQFMNKSQESKNWQLIYSITTGLIYIFDVLTFCIAFYKFQGVPGQEHADVVQLLFALVFLCLDAYYFTWVLSLKGKLPPEMAADAENIQRFHNEARSAAQLDHENIARVFFYGEDQGLHFIAFVYVDGETLQQRLERQDKLSVPEALQITLQIASGLVHAAARAHVAMGVRATMPPHCAAAECPRTRPSGSRRRRRLDGVARRALRIGRRGRAVSVAVEVPPRPSLMV